VKILRNLQALILFLKVLTTEKWEDRRRIWIDIIVISILPVFCFLNTCRLSRLACCQNNWFELSSYCSALSRFQQRKNWGIKCLWFKYLSQLDKNRTFTFKARLNESNSWRTSKWDWAVNTDVFSQQNVFAVLPHIFRKRASILFPRTFVISPNCLDRVCPPNAEREEHFLGYFVGGKQTSMESCFVEI